MSLSEEVPKIWVSKFSDKTENVRNIDFYTERKKLDYIHEFRRNDPVERAQAPDYIFFDLMDLKPAYKSKHTRLDDDRGRNFRYFRKVPRFACGHEAWRDEDV